MMENRPIINIPVVRVDLGKAEKRPDLEDIAAGVPAPILRRERTSPGYDRSEQDGESHQSLLNRVPELARLAGAIVMRGLLRIPRNKNKEKVFDKQE